LRRRLTHADSSGPHWTVPELKFKKAAGGFHPAHPVARQWLKSEMVAVVATHLCW